MNTIRIPATRHSLVAIAILIGLAYVLVEAPHEPAFTPPGAAVAASDASAAATALELAVLALTEERGRAYVALHAAAPIDEREWAALESSRARSAEALDEALDGIGAAHGTGYPVVDWVRLAAKQVASLREEVALALEVPRNMRDASLPRRWFREVNELIVGVDRTLAFAGLWSRGKAPGMHGQIALRRHALQLADMIGRERATIGAAIVSGEPIGRAELHALATYRNRMANDWRRLERSVSGAHDAQGLNAELEHVRRVLFEDLATARDLVLASSARRAAYPFTAALWFSFSTQGIEALATLRHHAVRPADATAAPGVARSPVQPRASSGIVGGV